MTSDRPGADAAVANVSRDDVAALVASRAVPALIALLGHPSWSVRRAIVAGLGSLADGAVPALALALCTERGDEAKIAANVDALVASSGDVERALDGLLDHDDPHVVADVAQILGRRRRPRSVTPLIALTTHRDDNVAVVAMEGLGRLNSRAAVDALLACLQSGQFFRAFPAIDVLGRTGDPRVVAPLSALLHDPRYGEQAARALGRTGDRAAVAALSELLASPRDATVRMAALALTELRARHVELYGVASAVEDALRKASSEHTVRRLGEVLSRARGPERLAICTLLGALQHPASLPLLESLLAAAPALAEAATLALRRFGGGSERPELMAAVLNADSAGRRVLLPLLNWLSAVTAATACLDDVDPVVRAMACEALARIGNPDALPALFQRFEDDNARVVHAAMGAVQSLGAPRTEALALLAARAPGATTRRAALRVLAYFAYPSALDVLREAAGDADLRVREVAIQGLAYLDDPAAHEAILAAAMNDVPGVRAAAMRALGVCAEADPRLLLALRVGLADADAWVRYYAAQALGKLRDEAAAPALAELLHDAAGQVRVGAIEALSHLKNELAMAVLTTAAQSLDLDVKRAALVGLSLARYAPALPYLRDACRADDTATRLVALSALAAFDARDVVDVLARAARDADEGVRTAAVGFLSARPDIHATACLIDLLDDAEPNGAVLNGLALSGEGRIPGLLAALQHADDRRAPLLTSSLARLRSPAGLAALTFALGLANPAARKAAVTTLCAIGAPDAYDTARRLARDDPDSDVRRASAALSGQ